VNFLDHWFEWIYSLDIAQMENTFPLVARGASRWVYAISDDFVIKVATCRDGEKQCRVENHVFNHAGSYLKRYLCPIVWYDRGMVVMLKATPLVPLEQVVGDPVVDLSRISPGGEAYRDMRDLSRKFNLLYEDLISVTAWGIINNRPVLIDYGCKN